MTRGGGIRESPPPEGFGRVHVLPLDPGDVVPEGMYGREVRLGALAQGLVRRQDLAEDERDRKLVQDQRVEAPDQVRELLVETHQRPPAERHLVQVEAALPFALLELGEPQARGARGDAAEVELPPDRLHPAVDDLQGLVPPLPDERRPQGLVAGHRAAPGFAKPPPVEIAAQLEALQAALASPARQALPERRLLERRQREDPFDEILARLPDCGPPDRAPTRSGGLPPARSASPCEPGRGWPPPRPAPAAGPPAHR